MAFQPVPMHRYDWHFFDKQRDLFPKYSSSIELDVHGFNNELEKWRNGMHQLQPFDMQAGQPMPVEMEWPFVEDADGNRKLSLTYNCAQFNPEDIEVKTNESSVTVHAKHTEGGEGNTMTREFTRTYNLPERVDHRKVVSHLTSDGVLHIEAPAPPDVYTRKEFLIPIQRLKEH